MKQYSQEDVNTIVPIDEAEPVVKKVESLELPQAEPKDRKEFNHAELHDALMFVEDKLERSQVPFVLLGETAESVKSTDLPLLEGQLIHIGVMKRYFTKDTLGMWETVMNGIEHYRDEDIITFEYKGVPIEIDIIHGDYPFFKYPDTKTYYLTQFQLPNPFNEYLKWKDQIR